MNNDISIEIQNVTKTFSGIDVIKNCNMTVQSGSIYGLLGVNGAGKTTIFKMLTSLLIPDTGKISILGSDMPNNKNKILRSIGSIIETPIFYEHLSARENLYIHLSYMGSNIANVDETLAKVGLCNVGEQPVSKFSLGMRQRLGIARALVHNPQILILDEPINGLDPIGIREIRKLFLDIVEEKNITILVSSHILSEIEHIADKIGVIVNGTIVEEVAISSIRQKFPNGLEDYFFNVMNGGKKCLL